MTIGFHGFANTALAGTTVSSDGTQGNISGASFRMATSSRQQRHIQERVAEKEREMRLRETENLRIEKIHEEMGRVEDSDMDEEVIRLTLQSLRNQVSQIHLGREMRQQAAVERELNRQQAEFDERMREMEERRSEQAESQNNQPMTEEEIEEAIERETIRHMTIISTRMDNIRGLSRTRASLAAKATRLENEHDESQSRQELNRASLEARAIERSLFDSENGLTNWATVRAAEITAEGNASLSYNLQHGFHGTLLEGLNMGIARIDANITAEISAMYRDSQAMQNEQLRLSQEQPIDSNEENEYSQESGYPSFDIVL